MLKCYERFYSKIFAFLSNRVPLTKLIVFLIYALFILIRLPHNPFNGGRIIAEDGTVFLAYAWHSSFGQAIFRSYAGYLNIAANGTGVFTAFLIKKHLISMADASVCIGGVAFFFQLLPAVLIIWGRADWLPSNKARIAGVAVIALCPKCEEVWLNGMHIQFWLALCCGLILTLDIEKNYRMWLLKGSILFLGPLSGPISAIMALFFGIRSWVDRSLPRLFQTVVIGTAGLIQFFFFYSPLAAREHHLGADIIANGIVLRSYGISFLGPISGAVGHLYIFLLHKESIFSSMLWVLLTSLSVILMIYTIYLMWIFKGKNTGWFVCLGFVCIVVPFVFGALIADKEAVFHLRGLRRYNFLPVVFMGLSLLSIISNKDAPRFVCIQRALLCLFLFFGVKSFFTPLELVGPAWQVEAMKWEKDHNYHPLTWVFPKGADLSDDTLKECGRAPERR